MFFRQESLSSNDTRGNRFAALSEAGGDGQHFGHRGRFPARRRLVLVSQHRVADSPSRERQMLKFKMLWNLQLFLNPLKWIECGHQERS